MTDEDKEYMEVLEKIVAGIDLGTIDRLLTRIEKLEAALRLYACEKTCPNCYGQVQDTRYCGWTARKALEGKDD